MTLHPPQTIEQHKAPIADQRFGLLDGVVIKQMDDHSVVLVNRQKREIKVKLNGPAKNL